MIKVIWKYFEEAICGVVFLCMTFLGFVNVVARNFTNFSLASTQELVINGMVILTVFGAAIAARNGHHLAVTVLYDSVPRKFRRMLVVISTLLIVVTLVLCSCFTYDLLANQYASGVVSSALQIPQWCYTLILPLGFVVLLIRQTELAVHEFKKLGANQE